MALIILIESCINILGRRLGFDVFVNRDAPGCGFFDFERDVSYRDATDPQRWSDAQLWGMGLHIIVSRNCQRGPIPEA